MALEVVVRKWGNSVGVVFPKEFVKENKIEVNDRVKITVAKEADFRGIFGSLKRGVSGQQFKDEARKGWN
jgi:hypothetical protein